MQTLHPLHWQKEGEYGAICRVGDVGGNGRQDVYPSMLLEMQRSHQTDQVPRAPVFGAEVVSIFPMMDLRSEV